MSSFDDYADWIKNDLRNQIFIGKMAIIAPRITGSLSIIGSAFVVTIILRSSTRLSSTYHRIIMGMALLDILGSTAIVLASFPFPKDDKWVEVYNYKGTIIGNYASSDAQGFFHIFGFLGEFLYYTMLCAYYACALVFLIEEKDIKKFVEPWMHIIPLSISLWISVEIQLVKGYNPHPGRASWSTMSPLPYSCLEPLPSPPCERGNKESHLKFKFFFLVISTVVMVIIIVCLSMVIIKAIKLYLKVKKLKNGDDDGGGGMTEQEPVDLDNRFIIVRATCIQAISYILALLFTIIPPFLLLITPPSAHITINTLYLVTFPLLGFVNFLIFVGAKVYHYRRVDAEASISKALGLILFTSFHDTEEIVFLGISALGRGGDLSSSSSSQTPSDLAEDAKDNFNDSVESYASLDVTNSIDASGKSRWDGISWQSQSTNNKSSGVSEFELSENLSLSTK